MKLIVPKGPFKGEMELPISKSIANRMLIISAMEGKQVILPNSLPEDVRSLRDALHSTEQNINIGMAGTAMRFLTAFYATQEGAEVVLTGDDRMKQRPISELVNGLRQLGVEIEYLEQDGFPPLRIRGRKLAGGSIEISASVSSQFISALMLIAPTMKNGLAIKLKGKVLSRPYITLTANCMRQCGIEVQFEKDLIFIPKGMYQIPSLNLESDWTAASYFYAMAAAKPNSKLLLKGLYLNSWQGDSIAADWFKDLGVSSTQKESGVEICSTGIMDFPEEIDFIHNPDLAQTFAFLAVALGRDLKLTGLDNLRMKETDRIAAMKTELEKLGVSVLVEENAMTVSGAISTKEAQVKTYSDHRMAMSAAVLSTVIPTEIENPEVVEKSFPEFWEEVIKLEFVSNA